MSMLALESDKAFGLVGPKSAVLISSFASPEREAGTNRASLARRTSAPVVHAWSMDFTPVTTTTVRFKKDECPPEAYLG